LTLVFIGLLLQSSVNVTNAHHTIPIALELNGRALVTNASPFFSGGHLMLPARELFEAMGGTVVWNLATRTLNVSVRGKAIQLTVGQNTAMIDDTLVSLAQTSRISRSILFINAQPIIEALGDKVVWDATRRVLAITRETRNVIFFHPDGFGLSHWGSLRTLIAGTDGKINWDRLPHMAPYTGHMKDGITGTSHGGATVHAYGVKVLSDSFGLDGTQEITALSGQRKSIMEEAIAAGYATALIQTGSVTEPGTAAFVSSVEERGNHAEIARQLIESGVDIIMGGGERDLLPQGVNGRHGAGRRTDGLNLIERARQLGYTVVYTRDELMALPSDVTKVLGVFASAHTFNDRTEESLRTAKLPLYVPTAPTISEMSEKALEILSRNPKIREKGFFMVAEEEGTDNFPNNANAPGSFEAGKRADAAFGVFADFVTENPNTLLITAADSNAGNMNINDAEPGVNVGNVAINTNSEGTYVEAPLDGIDGAASAPFVSAKGDDGVQRSFSVTWASPHDLSTGILARAKGLNAQRLSALGVVDNTDIYRIMYYTLFDRWLD
jgi:alkaline phosphatase